MNHMQFEYFYREHHRALRSFALKLTKNKMDADDLVQETAIKAFRNFNTFIKGSNFKNWSFTILKNTFITKFNKRKKSKIVSLPVEEMEYAAVVDVDPDQHEIAQQVTTITSEIEALSPKSKTPLMMYVEGYQYQEIAKNLGIPIGTVKSRISYARTKLKQTLSSKSAN